MQTWKETFRELFITPQYLRPLSIEKQTIPVVTRALEDAGISFIRVAATYLLTNLGSFGASRVIHDEQLATEVANGINTIGSIALSIQALDYGARIIRGNLYSLIPGSKK